MTTSLQKLSRAFWALVIVMGLARLSCNSDCLLAQAEETTKRKPDQVVDLGLFTLESFRNTSVYHDHLRLFKSSFKRVIREKSRGEPIATQRITLVGELVRCEDMIFVDGEARSLIKCEPLESHINQSSPETTGNTGLYSLRLSARAKLKLHRLSISGSTQIEFYELAETMKPSMILTRINAVEWPESSFLEPMIGYYMEAKHGIVSCSGYIMFAGDEFPLTERLPNKAIFLSIEKLKCTTSAGVGVSMDLTIGWQPGYEAFPYLIVRHKIRALPLDIFWSYDGVIQQTAHADQPDGNSGGPPTAYNTSVSIVSTSMLDWLNFRLNQTFVNTNKREGFETMTLEHPWMSMLVKSDWNALSLSKVLRMLLGSQESQSLVELLIDIIPFKYSVALNVDGRYTGTLATLSSEAVPRASNEQREEL